MRTLIIIFLTLIFAGSVSSGALKIKENKIKDLTIIANELYNKKVSLEIDNVTIKSTVCYIYKSNKNTRDVELTGFIIDEHIKEGCEQVNKEFNNIKNILKESQ